MNLTKRAFWTATFERVVASIAGGALAVIPAEQFGVIEADWKGIASVALGAGVFSLLKALAANHVGTPGPSLANEVPTVSDDLSR